MDERVRGFDEVSEAEMLGVTPPKPVGEKEEALPTVVFLTSTPSGQECVRRVEKLHWLPWMFRTRILHLPDAGVQDLAQLEEATTLIEIVEQRDDWELTPLRAAVQSKAISRGIRFVVAFATDEPECIIKMMITSRDIAAAKNKT